LVVKGRRTSEQIGARKKMSNIQILEEILKTGQILPFSTKPQNRTNSKGNGRLMTNQGEKAEQQRQIFISENDQFG
jgi:hypothetical protein